MSGSKVADGRWCATKGNLDTIKGAVTAARTALNSLEKTVETLTAGSLDGLTSPNDAVSDSDDSQGSALGRLNAAYELFAGVWDSTILLNLGINDGVAKNAPHRKLKGHLKPYSEHEATPLGLAATAIVELFNETNAPTIPLDFVLNDTSGELEADNS
ncbi:hypothetical protein AN643_01575 [Candidatus Epulonipiscioides saccharophilum]|nr:hypothetical protein AN643_01575 [Epulopiscium sp. SCG-B10WGA-EpuloB]